MDARELDILHSLLPSGRAGATSVRDLVRVTGLDERTVRQGIEQLVNERRIPVVTLTTNPGVFIARTPDELDLADAHLRSKAMAILHRRRSLRLCREELAWSPTLFGREVA